MNLTLDSQQVLTGGARDLPTRQQTLRNTLQWSYELLSQEQQRLFRWLSIFVGGCTLQAAEALCQVRQEDGNQASRVLDGVASLLDKSLVQQTEQEGDVPRLVMLETIREFGLECLQQHGELEAARRAHARYYLTPAQALASHETFPPLAPQTPQQAQATPGSSPTAPTRHPSYPAGLTARKVEVLRLVAQGMTDAQVAEQLIVSPRTVNWHLSSIYSKLGVSSPSAATRFAIEHKLV